MFHHSIYTKLSILLSDDDCNLANEWWIKFNSLSPEKLDQAKAIIAKNKFKDGDYECADKDILEVLSYYKITRNEVENHK